MTRKTDAEKPLSEQEKFFAQYGMANQKNFSDLVTNAVLVSGTNDLMLEDENGDIGHFDWFSFSNYGVSCSAEMLSTLALLDAGVANSPAYDRTITKQKFTEAQRSVAKSLYFTKVGEDGKVVRGDFFSLMDDEHIKIDDNGRILADETSSLAVAAIVNLYNTMLPMYIAIRSLGEAYNDELKGSISNELFGGTKNSNEDALVKQIEQLQKQLDAAKESEARAMEVANTAEQKLNQSKKRENALASKLEAAYSEIDELMAQIPESAEEDETPTEPDEPAEEKVEDIAMDYSGALDDILKKNTVVIVGGNQNLMKKFQVTHPDASIVAKDMIAVCDQQIRNADVVMFKADSLSHALYGKCKAICQMLMHMAVAAYTAASIDKVDAPLEKVWEAIDAGNESSYDSETVQIAKEKVKIFRTALFNATYYTMLCEQTKKTVLDGLQDYFFNPQGTRLNNELKKCKRQMERDGELLKQQKESLKEYKVRADAAERAAEDARNRYAGIQSKVESQQKQITDLEEQLKALREENARLRQQLPAQPTEERVEAAPAEPDINYEEELSKIFSAKKIVFVGGHPNIMGKFAQKYPNAAVVEKDKAMTADRQLDGAAAVLFKTDSMGHKEYTPIKDLAGRKGVPVGYIRDVTSLNLVEQSVYEELKKLNITE